MDEQLTLTVYFEDPYWVGVWERVSGGQLRVCRVVFGAEPTDAQILQWVLTHWRDLRFSPAVAHTVRPGPGNPKRAQREAHRAAHGSGIGTKAQQALQAQREQPKPNGGRPPAPGAWRRPPGGLRKSSANGWKSTAATENRAAHPVFRAVRGAVFLPGATPDCAGRLPRSRLSKNFILGLRARKNQLAGAGHALRAARYSSLLSAAPTAPVIRPATGNTSQLIFHASHTKLHTRYTATVKIHSTAAMRPMLRSRRA